MSYDTETARRYRKHAMNLRSLAADYEASETAEMLRGVARDYETMAQKREGMNYKDVARLKT